LGISLRYAVALLGKAQSLWYRKIYSSAASIRTGSRTDVRDLLETTTMKPLALCVLTAPIALCALAATPSRAQEMFVETVYRPTVLSVVPTAYGVPRTYFATTSWLTPTVYVPTSTSFVVPTSTSYVIPTIYRPSVFSETSFLVRRGLFRRPLLATTRTYDYSLIPTTYVVPTVRTVPLVSTSEVVCDPTPICAPATVASPAVGSPGTGNSGSGSQGSGGEPQLDPKSVGVKSTPLNGRAGNAGDADVAPPVKPAPDGANEILEPRGNAPADGDRHEVRRPVFNTARSQLRGRITSAMDGSPQGGVVVVLRDARERFADKKAKTGDDGRFHVILPEGDWSVQVPTTDGKAFYEKKVTVAGGLITDEKDQEVSNLTFNR
jgi:hypothetical protein